MWPFSRKSRRHVGIDIGTSSIKVVELERTGEHLNLINYSIIEGLDFFGELPTNPNVPSTLKISDNDIVLVLRRLLDLTKIQTVQAVMSIPIFSSFLTVMEMPFMVSKELENAVPFEARSYIPVPLSEVVLDWLAIPPREKIVSGPATGVPQKAPQLMPPPKITVLLVAVPKEVVSKYERIAASAKLNLAALESESFSLARSLVGNDLGTIMLIDFGARSTNLTVIDKGFIRMSHSAELSGREITKVVAHGLNVVFQRADELKKIAGLTLLGTEKGIAELISPFVDKLVVEVERMAALYLRKENQRLEKVILTGGSANLPGLMEYLSRRLGLEVAIGNPFSRLKFDPALEAVLRKELPSSLAVSAGLAMRDL